jgi:mycothiol synthase
MILREKFTFRHYLPEDYPALAELINASNRALGIENTITAGELSAIIESPEFNPRTDSRLLEDSGRIIAMSHHGFSAETGRCWDDSVVHPDYWGQGIGTELLRLTEARCLQWADSTLKPDHPVLLQLAVSDRNTRAKRLFEAHSYQRVRTFYQMRIEFDVSGQKLDAPTLPAGLVLRPFDPVRDALAVYEAHMDAFADHWGFERDSYEEWEQQTLKHPQNDFSLWLVASDGDQIAGLCLNRAGEGDDPHMAWVWVLGVRRAWRRQGLGEALLRTSFARFQARGFERAGLMVDSSNPTNAVALYERVGMHVQRSKQVYHKMLRGDQEDHREEL